MSSRIVARDRREAYRSWEPPVMTDGAAGAAIQAVTAQRIEEIQRQAYDEGFALGRQEALAATRTPLLALLAALDEPLAEMDEAVTREVALLVQSVARQLIRRELKTDPGEIVGVVREAMGLLPATVRNVRLHLHPEDAQLVRAVLSINEGDQHWRVVDDSAQTRGGCQVLTDTSRIDASLETRLAAAIAKMLGGDREHDAPPEGVAPEEWRRDMPVTERRTQGAVHGASATAPGDVQDAQVPRETGMSEAAVALPLPSRDGVMPREGQDGPERPPSLESKDAEVAQGSAVYGAKDANDTGTH